MVDAVAGPQHAGGPRQQLGILDAVPAAPLAGPEEAALAPALQAPPGAGHGARAEPEGGGQSGQAGEAVQGAAAEAEIAADLVLGGVGGDRLGEDEVDEVVAVEGEAEAGAERQGLARLQAEGGGQGCGERGGLGRLHRTNYIARK